MKNFLFSFKYAFSGFLYLIKERNFRIHIFGLITVIFAGFCFKISEIEWIVVILTSAFVLGLEAINSAIERVCDLYSIQQNQKIKAIKDISAGAVLIAAICAIAVGVLVFWKYIFK